MESRVDDMHLTGPDESLLWLEEQLRQRGVKLKPAVIMRNGDSYSYLKGTYTLAPEGIYLESSDNYVKETIKDLGMDPITKGCKVPGTQKNILPEADGNTLIDDMRRSTYASCVMRLLYISQDRHDLVYTVKNLSRKVSQPSEEDWARLKKCAKYLIYRPRVRSLLRRGGT